MKSLNAPRIQGLYAITPDLTDNEQLCAMVTASLQGGAALIQYRNKTASPAMREQQASALLSLCKQYQRPLIINDDLDLCLRINADGVHLGVEDGNLAAARQRLGNHKILGASCYNRYELAEAAQTAGADYIAFGACFSSATKPGAVHAPLSLLSKASSSLQLPVIAIGGITLTNAAAAISAGASSVAVIGALFSSTNILQTAQAFSHLFTSNHHDLTQPVTV